MAQTRRDEQRLLSKDEFDLVAQTRHPALTQIEDGELDDLVRRLRDTRDRAQGIARRQRREMRGKAAPSGAKPASDDTGSMGKGELLSAAVKRANKERTRRQSKSDRGELRANAQRALDMKRQGKDPGANRPTERTANQGMNSIPNEKGAVSGAFDEAGRRPALERSHGAR